MGMGPGGGMGQELIPEMIKRKLKLTDEQNTKLEVVQQEQMKKNEIISKQHQELRIKLDNAIHFMIKSIYVFIKS